MSDVSNKSLCYSACWSMISIIFPLMASWSSATVSPWWVGSLFTFIKIFCIYSILCTSDWSLFLIKSGVKSDSLTFSLFLVSSYTDLANIFYSSFHFSRSWWIASMFIESLSFKSSSNALMFWMMFDCSSIHFVFALFIFSPFKFGVYSSNSDSILVIPNVVWSMSLLVFSSTVSFFYAPVTRSCTMKLGSVNNFLGDLLPILGVLLVCPWRCSWSWWWWWWLCWLLFCVDWRNFEFLESNTWWDILS